MIVDLENKVNKKVKVCPICNREFYINFVDASGKNICLFSRIYCLECKPKRKSSIEYYPIIIDAYPKFGMNYCIKNTGLSKNQINFIVSKFDLKILPQTKSLILSESHIKTPEKCEINHNQFTDIKSPIPAYILGLLWTDGHISKSNNTIFFTTTYPDSEEFRKYFYFTGEWKINKYKDAKHPTWKERINLYTTNKHLHGFLANLGFQNKDDGFKKILNHIPKKFTQFFIRGLVDGDGCFYINKTSSRKGFSLCSEYKQNWDDLVGLFNNLEIGVKIRKEIYKNYKCSKLLLTSQKEITKLGDFIYSGREEDNIGLTRKYKKFLDIKNFNLK